MRLCRLSPATLALLAAGLATAGLAWACVPTAEISVDPRSGPSGSQVTVTGSTFGERTVEIRWNSQTGPLLATAQGPAFSATVTIPAAPAGVKVLKAVAYEPDGTVAGSAGVPFEVTAPDLAPPSPPAGVAPGGPAAPEAPAPQPLTGTPPARVPKGNGVAPQRERRSAGERNRPGSRVGARADGGVVTRGKQVFFADSFSAGPALADFFSAGPAAAGAREPTSQGRAPLLRSPSDRSALTDLWSGFDSGSALGRSGSAAGADAPRGQLSAILGLIGLGLLTLFTGIGVALARRRRSVARTSA